ncbi:MAG: hypothetical protein IPP29_03330 [Bacteroidetes bacterium]|nr:hypothetical protein [Bacteroidota bacterium]
MPTANEIASNGKLNVTQTIIQQQEKLKKPICIFFELKRIGCFEITIKK